MSALAELLLKEVVLLAVLTLVGSGAAAQLRAEHAPGSRLALAPAFGLALAAAVLMAVNLVTPLEDAFWFVLLPTMAVSGLLAVRSVRRQRLRLPRWRELAGLALVLACALTVFNAPLAVRDSVGPVGYGIFDAPGYIAFIDGYAHERNDRPAVKTGPSDFRERRWDSIAWGEPWDISLRYGWGLKWQHTGSDSVPAAFAGIGFDPWSTLTPFMVALICIGAMGTFGLARALTQQSRILWPAVLAGALYAGPMLLQVFVDGSQGLLAGVALFPALLTVGIAAFRAPSWRTTVLAGMLLAGLQAVYPELLPLVAGAAFLVIVGLGVGAARRRSLDRFTLRSAAGYLVAVAVLAVVLSPRTAPWALTYVTSQFRADSLVGFDTLIDYNMGARFLPGWVFQTREFYSFAFSSPGGLRQEIWNLGAPLGLGGVMVVGLVAFPRARLLIAVLAFATLQSVAASRTVDCSYCVQRTLFTLAPVLPALLAAGLVALATQRRGWLRAGAVVVGLLTVLTVGRTIVQVQDRAITGAYMSSPELRDVADRTSDLEGTVNLQGFDATPLWAWGNGRTTYNAIKEATDERISMPGETHEWGGFAYVEPRPPGHPAYTPDYDWVLNRFGGLDTGRDVVYRRGPMTLERPSRPFDVSVVSGVAVDTAERDAVGVPWVQPPGTQMGFEQGPLSFWVAATTSQRAAVRLKLAGNRDLRVTGPPGTRQRWGPDGVLSACIPVPGRGSFRILNADVLPPPPGLQPPPERLQNAPVPAKTVRLVSVRATPGGCRGAATAS